MLKKILLDQERILVHDTLSYMAGPIKIESQIVLTNHRILVLPHKKWSQTLGYQRQNVIWTDVRKVTLGKLDKNIQIETPVRTLSLWGTGARRMFEWIEQWRKSSLSLKTNWKLLESRQVVLSSEVIVSVGIGLAVKGELTISRHGFTVHYQTLSTNKDVFTWGSLTELSYSPMSQKLKFTVEDRHFTLQGNQAQLLNHLLDVFGKQDVFVDCLWETQWEDSNGKSSSGFMMLGQKALYFFPCSKQSSISNQPYIRIPCTKIQHLQIEDNFVKLFTSKNQAWKLILPVPDLWMGYMDRLLLHFWNAQHSPDFEDSLFCTQVHTKIDALTIGQIRLDDANIVFQPNGLRPAREIPVYEVVKMNKRSSRLSIQQDMLPEGFEFLDETQVAKMADQIEPKLSPMSVSFIGKNEPTDSILGRAKKMGVYMDGSLLVTITQALIKEENGVIKIQCSRFEEKIFIPHNVRVEVDVITRQGHYIFHALVLENNLNTPDMDGRYTLVTQQLGQVRLINQRAAFRVPTSTHVRFELQNCSLELDRKEAYLVDLSAGGCQIEYRHEVYEEDLSKLREAKVTVIVYIELEESKRRARGKFIQVKKQKVKVESIAFPAKIRRLFQPEDQKKVVMGLEFLENLPSIEHRLMRKILNLERALIQHHRRVLVRGDRE